MSLANRIYTISEGVMIEKLEVGMAVTKLGSNRFVILNVTGCAIWELLDGQTTCEMVIPRLAARFGQTPDAISLEVYTFIDRLSAIGLIVEKHL